MNQSGSDIDDECMKTLNEDYQIKFKSLRCYLNEKDAHFLIDPKILPCSNSACLECIRSSLSNGNDLNCTLCQQVHSNLNINELKSNQSLIDLIDFNSNEITNEIVDKLNQYILTLTDKFTGKNDLLDSLCDKAKREVSERVAIINAHLETLYKELLETLGQVKENVTKEIDRMGKQAEEKWVEFESFAQEMEKMLENFDANQERLETEIYACQSYIDDLDLLEEGFRRILRKVTFDESEWMPDESFVCEYIGKFKLNDTKDESESDSDD